MPNYIVAIDLGSSKIAGMVAERCDDGLLRVVAMDEEPSQGVKRGLIINRNDVVHSVNNIIKKLQNRINLDIEKVYIGLGGNTLRSFVNTVQQTYSDEKELTENDVNELLEQNQSISFPNESLYETDELDFLLNNDFLRFDPKGCTCTQIEGRYLLTFGKKGMDDAVRNCVMSIPQELASMYISPFAVSEAVITATEKELGSVVIDFGAETTSVVIYDNNHIRAMRVLPIGGASVTKDLCSLRLTQVDAEKLKKQHACALTSLDENKTMKRNVGGVEQIIETQELNKIVEARMDELMNMVCEEIDKSGYWGKLKGNIIITGGASQLKGLPELIALKTEMKVRQGNFDGLLTENTDSLFMRPENALLFGLMQFATENCCVDKKQDKTLPEIEPKRSRKKGGGFIDKIGEAIMGKLFTDREFEE